MKIGNPLKFMTGIKFQSEDIIQAAMTVQIALLPVILVWGLTLETLHAVGVIPASSTFDLKSFFGAVVDYELGVAALLGTGSAHMYFNKTKGADGTTTETTDFASGTTTKTIVKENLGGEGT